MEMLIIVYLKVKLRFFKGKYFVGSELHDFQVNSLKLLSCFH